jgi:hypothetical protein
MYLAQPGPASRVVHEKQGFKMKRFHIAIAVKDLQASIVDYNLRLGQAATAIVREKYAMWRTDLLNFSINQIPERAGQLRHVGFEDDSAKGFSSSHDVNAIEWELFSSEEQDRAIVERYGVTDDKLRSASSVRRHDARAVDRKAIEVPP